MQTSHKIPVLAALVALFGFGCAAPKVMTHNSIVGHRSAKTLYQLSGSISTTDSSGNTTSNALYDFSIQLCDFDESGAETRCEESLLLRNVTFQPLL